MRMLESSDGFLIVVAWKVTRFTDTVIYTMAKVVATIKAVVTRLVFAAHGLLAIWQVTIFKRDSHYWYLSAPVLLLFFEGIFTLTIKKSQEWKWFCPSVFLYLGSVVPAIWLLELDKLEKKQKAREGLAANTTAAEGLRELDQLLGPHVQLSALSISADTWLTLIEQFLMLILILGRWMLPKGDLTRDQLSQLLLVYIGTAADIIEFFDAFQDETIGRHPILTALTLAIWSWSLMQFTVVLTATKSSRRSRISAPSQPTNNKSSGGDVNQSLGAYCCSVDVWAILINIVLQDAPFVTFRLLLIIYYRIISYMNVFFTCKNTLVIALQLYRLYVVYAEKKTKTKQTKPGKKKRKSKRDQSTDIASVLAAIESGSAQYYSDFEEGILPSRGGKKGRRGRVHASASALCSELGFDHGANPASNLRLLLDPEIPCTHRQGRRKSMSADNLAIAVLGEQTVSEEDEDAVEEYSAEEEENEGSSTAPASPEQELLAQLSPAQLHLLRAAANTGSVGVGARSVRQDTGYSTASSSHGSVRQSRGASTTSSAVAANRTKTASVAVGRRGGKSVKKGRSTRNAGRGEATHQLLLHGEERV